MVQAYILVQTEVGRAADVARQIAEIAGVMQAEDVTGPYDVIVRAAPRTWTSSASWSRRRFRPSKALRGR